jgi:hypothetical protein
MTVRPLDLHKGLSRAYGATLAGVPPCAGECRFCLWETCGERRRGPDLWDFCGASGRAARPIDDSSESCVASATLDPCLALVVEIQHRDSGVGELLALLGTASPPFNRGPVARDDRLAEPALDILLNWELLAQIAADPGEAQVRRPERGRAIYHRIGIQGGDGFSIAPRPGSHPGIGHAPANLLRSRTVPEPRRRRRRLGNE